MIQPRPLLHDSEPLALYDAAANARLERRAAAALPRHALMALAGHALARLARAIAPHARVAWIVAGPGNNGGDGLLLASLLQASGVEARVSLVGHAPDRALPDDAAWALARAQQAGVRITTELPSPDPTIGLSVDAIFGVGQRRAAEGVFAEAIAALNRQGGTCLAVDLPTGLSGDTGAPLGNAVVHATDTLTLLVPKPGLFTGAGREHGGRPWFDDLGVAAPPELAVARLTGRAAVAARVPPRRHLAHKGTFGDVHVVGGAPGMTGAALMAGRSAARAGAGRVYLHLPAGAAALPVDPLHPELMLRPSDDPAAPSAQALAGTVVAGCGGGEGMAARLPDCLEQARQLVLDADALNAIALDEGLRGALRQRTAAGLPTVLTPHPLEAARLLGTRTGDVQGDRLAAARTLAHATGAVVVLKGSGSVIATPTGDLWVNPTGDARLATAGTGDVLAGWLAGLWAAQPAAGADADAIATAAGVAAAAVYLHGLACEFAPGRRLPLTAGDLVEAIGRATEQIHP